MLCGWPCNIGYTIYFVESRREHDRQRQFKTIRHCFKDIVAIYVMRLDIYCYNIFSLYKPGQKYETKVFKASISEKLSTGKVFDILR